MQLSNPGAPRVREDWPERFLPEVYVVVALFVGMFLCLLTPPFFIADEPAHSMRAIELGHGEPIARKTEGGVGAWMDGGAHEAMLKMVAIQESTHSGFSLSRHMPDGRVSAADLRQVQGMTWTRQIVFASFPNTALYPPTLYLPQALGWHLGERAGWTIVRTLLLARVLTAWTAITLGWLALRLCAGSRFLLFAYLLLPAVLGLMASCSQDALLLPVAALIFALVSRAVANGRTATLPELAGLAVCVAVSVGARVPYLPMVLVLFLPVCNLRSVRWRHLLAPTLGVLVILVVCGWWQVRVQSFGTPSGPGAEVGGQIHYLREHPLAAAGKVAWSTVRAAPRLGLNGVESLDAGSRFAPRAAYGLLLAAIAGIAMLSPRMGLKTASSRALLVFLLVAIPVGISLAEYIIWTPPGADAVAGLQSRYYLPLVPLAFLLLHRRATTVSRKNLLTACGVLFTFAVLLTPWIASHRFYGVGPIAGVRTVLMGE